MYKLRGWDRWKLIFLSRMVHSPSHSHICVYTTLEAAQGTIVISLLGMMWKAYMHILSNCIFRICIFQSVPGFRIDLALQVCFLSQQVVRKDDGTKRWSNRWIEVCYWYKCNFSFFAIFQFCYFPLLLFCTFNWINSCSFWLVLKQPDYSWRYDRVSKFNGWFPRLSEQRNLWMASLW